MRRCRTLRFWLMLRLIRLNVMECVREMMLLLIGLLVWESSLCVCGGRVVRLWRMCPGQGCGGDVFMLCRLWLFSRRLR